MKSKDYLTRLLKLIPSEIVALYLVVVGLIPVDEPESGWVSLIVSVTLLAVIPMYLLRMNKVNDWKLILVTSFSFVIWVYTLGGPFAYWGIHKAYIGSILLILWTGLLPLIYKPVSDKRFNGDTWAA